jgi:hypothetical protein
MYRSSVPAIVLALTVSVLCTTSASAGNPQENFEKLRDKLLVTTGNFRPKVLCVCLNTNEVGVLSSPAVPQYLAYCTTPTFDGDGNVSALTNCGPFTMVKP